MFFSISIPLPNNNTNKTPLAIQFGFFFNVCIQNKNRFFLTSLWDKLSGHGENVLMIIIMCPNEHELAFQVAYKGYIMDGPNEAVGVGSRVTIRLQQERVFDKLHHVSLERMKKIHPGLKLLTWGAMDSDWYCDESQMKRKNISVIERWVIIQLVFA